MLKIENISKTFDGNKVLDNINIYVNNGSIYGLIGKNGVGKTTLMNIVAGLSTPDIGVCGVYGEDEQRIDGAKVGYLPDLPSFFEYLSAKEYIDFLLMNSGNKQLSQRRDELLKTVGVPAKSKVGTMSRGMKQRLGIAAALVNDPEVILLDEPTSALDPMGRYELMEILNNLKNSGKSILLSTHILADMEKVCDKVGFLHNGIIQKEVDIADFAYGESSSWEVTFEHPFHCDLTLVEGVSVRKLTEITYVFESTDQKRILEILMKIPTRIVHIGNQRKSLDDWFQEVCK